MRGEYGLARQPQGLPGASHRDAGRGVASAAEHAGAGAGKGRALSGDLHHRECYGDPLVHPQVETYWGNVNPVGPRSCYDESKRFAEALTMAYHRKHGVRTNIARIFNTYGPRMKLDDGRVVPAFLDQALRGEPMTVFGYGSQTRSFCYVSDLVDGLFRLMQSDERYPVNLGNPLEMTILEFAEHIRTSPAASRRWSSSRCRRTIPSSASPISPRQRVSWVGSHVSRSGTA